MFTSDVSKWLCVVNFLFFLTFKNAFLVVKMFKTTAELPHAVYACVKCNDLGNYQGQCNFFGIPINWSKHMH